MLLVQHNSIFIAWAYFYLLQSMLNNEFLMVRSHIPLYIQCKKNTKMCIACISNDVYCLYKEWMCIACVLPFIFSVLPPSRNDSHSRGRGVLDASTYIFILFMLSPLLSRLVCMADLENKNIKFKI